jgi:hypothetical protein
MATVWVEAVAIRCFRAAGQEMQSRIVSAARSGIDHSRGRVRLGVRIVLTLAVSVIVSSQLQAQLKLAQDSALVEAFDNSPTPLDTTGTGECEPCREPNVAVATIETLMITMLSTVFNRVYFGEEGLAVSPESWTNNLERGWEFDNNPFTTNQLEHPFAGSLYFNAGRSNALDFWEAVPLTGLGSIVFEYFGEANRPSFSDFVTTTLGGISLGEAAYRLSSLVLDDEATGASRVLREIGGALLNPVRGFNRLASGQVSRSGPNAFDRSPGYLSMTLDFGAQQVGTGSSLENGYSQSYFELELDYADPIERDLRKPFETFRLVIQHEPSSGRLFDQLRIVGNLYGADLHRSANTRHKVMVGLNYDYVFNSAYKFGQHSVPVGIVSRWRLSDSWMLRTHAALNFVVLGAVNSGYLGRRDEYEYGPGMGFGIRARLFHRGYRVLDIEQEAVWIHTVSGGIANHLVQIGTVRLGWPVYRGMGVGFDAYRYQLNSYLQGHPSVSRRSPQVRAYLTWSIS